MKITICGGSGFLGSHIADELSNAEHEVTIFDIMESPWKNINQKMLVGSLLDKKAINEAVKDSDYVFNFAGISDIGDANLNPHKSAEVNILGNLNLLDACYQAKIKRYIFASSLYVYSNAGGFYRCSKQASESYVEEYQKIYGLDYTILRYGSLYGPRADKTNGLYRIVQSALKSGIVSYEGDVDAMREYIHVDDAARASIDALSDEFKNKSVVLTGQEPMRVIDMLKMLAEILGYSTESVKFIEDKYAGHYVRTPYAYQPKLGRKYIPPMHVDLGQGLLQVINEINRES